MKVYECPYCGYLVLGSVMVALQELSRDHCNNPEGCWETFANFKVLVEGK
jgi:hypothetical protein